MNLLLKEQMVGTATQTINRLVCEAVCKHLAVDDVNIYDHLNKMSKQEIVSMNTTICFYNGVPIFRMRLVPKIDDLGFDMLYEFK